jgi:hypothetical protein
VDGVNNPDLQLMPWRILGLVWIEDHYISTSLRLRLTLRESPYPPTVEVLKNQVAAVAQEELENHREHYEKDARHYLQRFPNRPSITQHPWGQEAIKLIQLWLNVAPDMVRAIYQRVLERSRQELEQNLFSLVSEPTGKPYRYSFAANCFAEEMQQWATAARLTEGI